ncbi:hypothetical protein GCM10011393_03440 [Sphingopyxis bauzanensis]|nr:hypothetical protein GCM10011393_03440 [Sphingopyxis bauzanensis]
MDARPDIWGNLAGPPVRFSPSTGIVGNKKHKGVIKIRLCHARGRSYFIPEVLIGFGGSKFFLPSFFGPPQLSFGSPLARGYHEATFSVDVAAPRARNAVRVMVTIRSDGHLRSFAGGAQLYRCEYAGPQNVPLAPEVGGSCTQLADGDFALDLFHHTRSTNAKSIMNSGELWSSSCNLAGTGELENVACVYFTTLPSIRDENDLRRVAMSSFGSISYQTTSDRRVEGTLELPVYKGELAARDTTLSFAVPTALIAPPHLLCHPAIAHNPAYYEVVGPEIVRVAVTPGNKLLFIDGGVTAEAGQLKSFDYVIEGDASSAAGLEAPMKEEATTQVSHLERLDGDADIFAFWKANANTDLVTGRQVEWRKLREKVA